MDDTFNPRKAPEYHAELKRIIRYATVILESASDPEDFKRALASILENAKKTVA